MFYHSAKKKYFNRYCTFRKQQKLPDKFKILKCKYFFVIGLYFFPRLDSIALPKASGTDERGQLLKNFFVIQNFNIALNKVDFIGANSLVGMFLRFRQEPIAIVGDIKSMFYQVFVSEQYRDALRFLWYPDGDLEKAPVDHRMNVHVFGSTSSPSAAAFALRRVAEDNASNVDPFVIETVLKNFYADDLCKSCSTVNEAVKLLDQLCRLLKNGGFHLTKFLSNSKDVLR